MKWLDLTFPTPAENLACDEALLDFCEEGGGQDILRFWEPRDYFVVVGYANKVALEVNCPACRDAKIAIFRRCSGGGTVVQGPGCLNYSLVLRFTESGPLRGITAANRSILERNRDAVQTLLSRRDLPRAEGTGRPDPAPATRHPGLSLEGSTDLAMGGLKFSGNAQRRRKHFLLFHGTFLLQFDLRLIETLLPLPSRQPAYRRNRPHADFLTNLGVPATALKQALRQVWNASEPFTDVPQARVALLARDKYVTAKWNLKF
jgi:lipoate---protein ligase